MLRPVFSGVLKTQIKKNSGPRNQEKSWRKSFFLFCVPEGLFEALDFFLQKRSELFTACYAKFRLSELVVLLI